MKIQTDDWSLLLEILKFDYEVAKFSKFVIFMILKWLILYFIS